MAYAERTTVPYEKTIRDIIALVKKAGAVKVGQMEDGDCLTIIFGLGDRQIKFRVSWEKSPASQRQRARALMLVIKAKLESVESGVETFEQAFLANIVLSDGKTVHERVSGDVQLEYRSGQPAVYLIGGPSE
ncbi:hypothetical protein [Sphingomonas sp. PP-CE-1G-424]|uniref:hypothetical protein n=1 Tax=Sphingomonas sp. PP-CE-1G-424 TaxID=2135658 RepID=UPI0010544908|nr:hypothetical protein [Sphingomonas sp. PP-CE-1G-424]TCP66307.1 hypothetical protein C8J43_10527 [Sphingomonas sp. PP-CE-1G-424]